MRLYGTDFFFDSNESCLDDLVGVRLTTNELTPFSTTPPDFTWDVSGADGAQTSSDTFEIANTPPPGTQFTVGVTATAANGCAYQAKLTYATGTQNDVDNATAICGIMQKLQEYIRSIEPLLPHIPIGPGDPFKIATLEGLRHLEQYLAGMARLAEKTRQIVEIMEGKSRKPDGRRRAR